MDILTQIMALMPFEFFARAGGGGSGGSGGGGSGDGIFVVLGYIPMHVAGGSLRKLMKFGLAATIAVNVIGWIIAVVYMGIWMYATPTWGFFIGLAGLFGMGAGLYGLIGKIKQNPYVKQQLGRAASQDNAWNPETLTEYAKSTFLDYQAAWSRRDLTPLRERMTPAYFTHATLLVAVLEQLGRHDMMGDIQITEATITSLNDSAQNDEDSFTIGFEAKANDQLIRDSDARVIFRDNSSFTEYWTFVRSGQKWLLAGISQATADVMASNAYLRAFATQHGYYYSDDMGWLFLPERGTLFDGGKFGTSDINNHVVGLYNNSLLIQLYSYVENPRSSNSVVIAQVNVPRQYGHIVVRHKKKWRIGGIRGLERVETEWTKFNDKYEVYASNYEQATSFELLNPTYMEQLEALEFEVNIEVVDNVIYLSVDERRASVEIYTTMLDLIEKAFKEMRL